MGMPNQQQIFQNSPNMPPMAQNNQMGIGVLPPNGSFGLNQVMALQLLGQAAGLQQSLPQFQNQLQNLNFLSSVQLGGQFLANNLAQSMNQFAAGANGQLGVNIPVLFSGTTAPNSGSFGNSNGMSPNFGDAVACVDAVNHEVNNGQLASNHEMGSRNHNFRGIAPNSGFGSNPNMAMSSSNANFRNAASNGVNCHAMGQGVKHGTPMAATKFRPPFSRSLSQSDGNNMVNCGEANGSGVSNLRNEYSTRKNFRTNPKGHERGGISNVRHVITMGEKENLTFQMAAVQLLQSDEVGGIVFMSTVLGLMQFVPIIYSEHEIKQWIEARKKNFPTCANIEKKKLALNGTNGEDAEENTKLCRQQLKEVLVKQAELGFEAPEIPPGYLSEPEGQLNGKPNERKTLNRSDGSLNRYNNKRGKYNQRDRRGKKPKLKKEPTTPAPVAREPTLLRKLLNTEIKGDKSRLLQAFRFVLLNSFFESWPEKPLEFPSITVQDTIYASTAVLGANPSPNDMGVSNFRKTDDQKDLHVVVEQNEGGDYSTNDTDMYCDFAGKENLKDSNVVDEAESSSGEDESDSVSDDTEQLEDSEEGEITE
ncbi:hypothetical protein ACMD2_01024 [Ananas comosus]|uniref:FMR1-interacting protein 1 conserved domain-containing protein n=1 Tax=Ananas comosus TaxID=4615 RepID=A0A199UX77_ANACO|nr:hypothetical protein ACMD2_01024 [Ananas comosus]